MADDNIRDRDRTAKVSKTYADNAYAKDTYSVDNPHLYRLRDLKDYKVAADDLDVRGWDVVSGDNEKIGKVDELIVDTNRMKVRYLVVDVKEKFAVDRQDHYMVVPVGAARLDDKDDDVIISNITTTNVSHYPVYRRDKKITREYESSIRRFYETGGTTPVGAEHVRDVHGENNEVDPRTSISGDVTRHGTGTISSTPKETRMKDRAQESSNSIRSEYPLSERRTDGKTPLGQFNHTRSSDVTDRIRTSGIASDRTSNLPNKDLTDEPRSNESISGRANPEGISESERVRIHDTDPNIEAPRGGSTGDFNSTSNMNRSTSLSDDSKRGSNMGNLEDKTNTPGISDRSRMSSPEYTDRTSTPGTTGAPDKYPEGSSPVRESDLTHSSDELPDYSADKDEFYTHKHFDEDMFYGRRRNRDETERKNRNIE